MPTLQREGPMIAVLAAVSEALRAIGDVLDRVRRWLRGAER